MGFFDWLKSLFGEKGYAAKQAMHYVKKNYDKYKVIKPSERKEFEQMFLSLANNEISRLNRLLQEEEINPLAQRIRIRQSQKKEKNELLKPKEIEQTHKIEAPKGEWTQQGIAVFTKIVSEQITPSLQGLGKSIPKVEFLEAKYLNALERKEESIFRNNKREFSDIEEEIRAFVTRLEQSKIDLIKVNTNKGLQVKIIEMITLWRETLRDLQQARITNNNEQKATILSTINKNLRKKHLSIMSMITQELQLQKERIQDLYTEMPQEYNEEQEAKAAK